MNQEKQHIAKDASIDSIQQIKENKNMQLISLSTEKNINSIKEILTPDVNIFYQSGDKIVQQSGEQLESDKQNDFFIEAKTPNEKILPFEQN